MTTAWMHAAREVKGIILDVDGVLTDGRLHYGLEGETMKSFHVRDGLGVVLLRMEGYRIGIISGRQSPVVQARADELGIDPCILGRHDKADALKLVLDAWKLHASKVAAIGDDLVDLPLLRAVGVSFAPKDADARVRAAVDHVVDHRGGHGAVRDVCEILLRASGKWAGIARRYGVDTHEDT